MKILALEHELPGATADQFQQHANDEALQVWEYHQAGIIRELYFRADRNEAVLVLECELGHRSAENTCDPAVCQSRSDFI